MMEHTPIDSTSEFTFDPTNKVVGVIDDARDVEGALRDLTAAGFQVKEVELLMDEEGQQRINLSDEVLVHIFRSTQKVPAYYDAPGLLERIQKELLEGHYLIGVYAKEPASRERVREILKSDGGHFINFYGRWAAEALDP
jgi:hypothetical protein